MNQKSNEIALDYFTQYENAWLSYEQAAYYKPLENHSKIMLTAIRFKRLSELWCNISDIINTGKL